ncbi:uncharacterized protein LOC128951481 [Oppia nitens]|uniref:uncharacterized protein LOC128951481 n=1 Tax=Oppia nitens TaxID=1686743 RepID=UPI0023DBB210|nr:uncharacterized protein LOC128951481 [Oppia nitens]
MDYNDLSPEQMAAYESEYELAIEKQTLLFGQQLQQCEVIVDAVYQVADYVPEFKTKEQSDFWKNIVIPNLTDILKDELFARSTIQTSFLAINKLIGNIQNGYAIVKASKGSKPAINIAKKYIMEALKQLEECIDNVKNLKSNAIIAFGKQTTEIFNIIGPEAAKFMKQKATKIKAIKKLFEEKNNLYI